jgi:Ni,Fe-hydrogenase III large subunit
MSALRFRAGQCLARDTVPALSFDEFRKLVTGAPSTGKRVSALFGAQAEGGVKLYAVLALDGKGALEIAKTFLEGNEYPAMTLDCPQVHLFEREIAEQWGIVPKGHPWLKPVRFVGSERPGRDAWNRSMTDTIGVTDFYRVEGEEVHEVAVGPVHAGVIEPGHFRFQCHGEHVFHLEISLGYQHRGVERALVKGPTKRTMPYIETLAGDTTIGHATAYCQAVESLSGARVTTRAHALRGIALELERLANHTGGLGALAGDVGFLPTASYCGRLRGDFLNMSAVICGNRFGRSFVRPGGVVFDIDGARRQDLQKRLDAALRDVAEAVELLWDSASVQARFEGTGVVTREVAEALGLVGVAARACGIERDVRHDHPSGIYRLSHIPVSAWTTGDVFARAFVRWLEIRRSCAFIAEQLRNLPKGEICRSAGPLKPNQLCVSLIEGWRGEICHVALTDDQGKFDRYKVVDPSFHNWTALAMALRDQQISDFPLCNKSFDLSYCGHDL